jgi:hypothetical protein
VRGVAEDVAVVVRGGCGGAEAVDIGRSKVGKEKEQDPMEYCRETETGTVMEVVVGAWSLKRPG